MNLFSQNDLRKLAISLEYNGDKNDNRVPNNPEEIGIHHLKGDGDFRSEEMYFAFETSRYCGNQPAIFFVS